MAELMIYLFKVSVCMILLYGIYVLTLRKETHFHFNRVYLLFSIIISLTLPILDVPLYSSNPGTRFSGILQTIQVGSYAVFIVKNSTSFSYFITLIYFAGLIILSIRFIARLISLVLLRRQCMIEKKNGFYLALCKKDIAPFSFFHTIFIDEKMLNHEQLDQIIIHETIHLRQLHSLDVVFAEILCLLTWFNPVSWMIKAALKETHEYLADSGVHESGFTEYFLLLTRNVVGLQLGLANNFNKSLTLKRLNMMKKTRSSRFSMLKALLVLPVVALLFITFSCGKKGDELKSQFSTATKRNDKQVNIASKMPEFPGGQAAMTKYLIDNVKYPEAAKKNGIEGIVYVGFIVTKNGKLDKIMVRSKEVNLMLAAEAIRVVSLMPKWIPGENNGVPVDVELTLPIYFKLAVK